MRIESYKSSNQIKVKVSLDSAKSPTVDFLLFVFKAGSTEEVDYTNIGYKGRGAAELLGAFAPVDGGDLRRAREAARKSAAAFAARGGARTGAGRPPRAAAVGSSAALPGVRVNQEEYLAVRKIAAHLGDGATISDAVRAAVAALASTLPEPVEPQ